MAKKKKARYTQQNRIREYLEWSWNYGAEEMADETTKGVARMISAGINKGEEQNLDDLVADFINLRCTDGEIDVARISFTFSAQQAGCLLIRDWKKS